MASRVPGRHAVTAPQDRFWDDLGVAWRAVTPDVAVLSPRLRSRLRRQSRVITTGLVVGWPLCAAGLGLGVWTIGHGWAMGTWHFIIRGVAIAVMSTLAAGAMSHMWTVRASGTATSVSEMLGLTIARAHRLLLTIRLGLAACAVALVMGLVGTAIRSYLAAPPGMSPVVDVAALMVLAIGFVLYGRHVRVTLERLQALKTALDMDGGA